MRPKKLLRALNRQTKTGCMQFQNRPAAIFFHPDYTVGTGITPVHAALAARGLYRRWGISPRPEDKYAVVLALYNTPCPAKMQPLSAGFFIYCFTVTFYCISINND